MPIVEKIKEVTEELHKTLEDSGAKDKAKSVSLTLLEVLGEGITEIENSVNRGFKNLEQKYEDNLAKVQSEKRATTTSMVGLEELERLASLHQDGVLTEDEFAEAKKRILERL